MRVGQARRRDANEQAIVDDLQQLKMRVWRISGPGAPDILVRHQDRYYPFEVKSKDGERTPAQVISDFPVIHSAKEAVALILGEAFR